MWLRFKTASFLCVASLTLVVVSSGSVAAQRTKIAAKPVDPVQQLDRLIKNSEHKFLYIGDYRFYKDGNTVEFEGALGYLLRSTRIAGKDEFSLTPELCTKLLAENLNIDFVKIGLNDAGDLMIRVDTKSCFGPTTL